MSVLIRPNRIEPSQHNRYLRIQSVVYCLPVMQRLPRIADWSACSARYTACELMFSISDLSMVIRYRCTYNTHMQIHDC